MDLAAKRKKGLKGASLHKSLNDSVKRVSEANSRDYATIADQPLRWLLLGLDAITRDFAPPPRDLSAEWALAPIPPPDPTPAKKRRASVKKAPAAKKKPKEKAAPKPAAGAAAGAAAAERASLPPEGTTERTAARLLLCLRTVMEKQQRASLQNLLQSLVQQLRPVPQSSASEKLPKREEYVSRRPRTPEVLEKVMERSQFFEAMRSQVWRRRELRDLPRPDSPELGACPPGLRRSASEAGPRGSKKPSSSLLRPSSFTSVPDLAAAKLAWSKNRNIVHAGNPVGAKKELPPVSKVKKYERGTPALGAGFKVLAGFRSGSAGALPAQRERKPPAPSPLLSLEGAVGLLKDAGAWPRDSTLPPAQQQLASQRSAGSPEHLAQSSVEFAQASTELGEPSAELSATLDPRDLEDADSLDGESIPDMGEEKVFKAQHLNPLVVFPHLAKRPPMPARRIYFTDPESDDPAVQAMRDPVAIRDVYDPPPAVTPSSVDSISELHHLMASTVRGSLVSSSRRKPRETSAELKETFDLALKGAKEALDEDSSEEEEADLRHPPRWTRKQSVLLSSGARDFGHMAPSRQPCMEAESNAVDHTPQWAFISHCAQAGVVPPMPRPIVKTILEKGDPASQPSSPKAGSGLRFDLGGRSMGDDGLQALSETMKMLGHIQFLNISGNALTCRATSTFLSVQVPPSAGTLTELDLSQNPKLGRGTIQCLIDLLQNDDLRMLTSLNLNSVEIPENLFEPLMKSLLATGQMTSLSIADTRCGFGGQTSVDAVAELISEGVLTSLDMSGNYFLQGGAQTIAKALERNATLENLDLSYTAGDHLSIPSTDLFFPPKPLPDEEEDEEVVEEPQEKQAEIQWDDPPFSPLLLIFEGVLKNVSLKKLSLSSCSLDYSADFMLAEAMLHHPNLVELDLSCNPHGVHGLACLIRAIGVSHSRVEQCKLSDIRSGELSQFAVRYNFRDPSGDYCLQLCHPQHRSVLRSLLDRPKQDGKDTKACFTDVSYTGGTSPWSLDSCKQDAKQIFEVPEDGVLRFKYGVPAATTPRGDKHPLGKAQDWHRRGLIHVNYERCIYLVAAAATCTCDNEISFFLEAIPTVLLVKTSHLKLFTQYLPPSTHMQVVQSLAPSVGDPGEIMEFARVLSNPESKAVTRANLRTLALLNLRNPTGHHRFRLSAACEYACVVRLQALAAFEARVRRAAGRPDISQNGNFEPIRNSEISNDGNSSMDFHVMNETKPFADAIIPSGGSWILELDYVTLATASIASSAVMPTEILEQICSAISHSKASSADALKAFRTVADRFAMSVSEIRKVAQTFADLAKAQAEAYEAGAFEAKARHRSRKHGHAGPARSTVHVDAAIACFGRCFEPAVFASNAFMYDGAFFSPEDCAELRARLGCILVFDWKLCHTTGSNFPIGNKYALDLSRNDEQVQAKFLLSIAKREGVEALTKATLKTKNEHDNWTESELAAEPAEKIEEWVDEWLSDFPKAGIFKVCYKEIEIEREEGDEGSNLSARKEFVDMVARSQFADKLLAI